MSEAQPKFKVGDRVTAAGRTGHVHEVWSWQGAPHYAIVADGGGVSNPVPESEVVSARPLRPSICRMVVLGFKDPTQRFSSDPDGIRHRDDDPHELPAVVVRVIDEDTLRIDCVLVGGPGKTLWRAYHRDLCPDDAPPSAYVWTWPTRSP